MIESSLLMEWAIRIEYQNNESKDSGWQLWNETHFAIRSASHVLEELLDCYARHPQSTIRICAEKFRPQTRLLYSVYNPQHLAEETDHNARPDIRQVAQRYEQPVTRTRLTPH